MSTFAEMWSTTPIEKNATEAEKEKRSVSISSSTQEISADCCPGVAVEERVLSKNREFDVGTKHTVDKKCSIVHNQFCLSKTENDHLLGAVSCLSTPCLSNESYPAGEKQKKTTTPMSNPTDNKGVASSHMDSIVQDILKDLDQLSDDEFFLTAPKSLEHELCSLFLFGDAICLHGQGQSTNNPCNAESKSKLAPRLIPAYSTPPFSFQLGQRNPHHIEENIDESMSSMILYDEGINDNSNALVSTQDDEDDFILLHPKALKNPCPMSQLPSTGYSFLAPRYNQG